MHYCLMRMLLLCNGYHGCWYAASIHPHSLTHSGHWFWLYCIHWEVQCECSCLPPPPPNPPNPPIPPPQPLVPRRACTAAMRPHLDAKPRPPERASVASASCHHVQPPVPQYPPTQARGDETLPVDYPSVHTAMQPGPTAEQLRASPPPSPQQPGCTPHPS